jgi:hypothetical protein
MGMIAHIIIAAKEQRPTNPWIAPKMDVKEPILVQWYKSALRTAKNISTMAGSSVHVPGSNSALGKAAVVKICRGASPSDAERLGNADSDKELLACHEWSSSMASEFQNCNSFVKILRHNIRRKPGQRKHSPELANRPVLIGPCVDHQQTQMAVKILCVELGLNCALWLHSGIQWELKLTEHDKNTRQQRWCVNELLPLRCS